MLKKVQILIIGIALAIVPVAFAGAPYNLTGTYSGQSIILTWDNGTYSGITNLRIYKKSQYSDFAILATLPKTAVSYTNINVEPYTLYTFKIVTMGIDGSEKETSSSFEIGSMTNVTQYYDLIRFENNTASAGGTIKFHYSVPAKGDVEIAILNTALDIIKTFNLGDQPAGTYPFTWDLKNSSEITVQPGMYVISLKAGAKREHKKVVVKR